MQIENLKVNLGYSVTWYDVGEVCIQTNPKGLEMNEGKIYLTASELRQMLQLAEHPDNAVLPGDGDVLLAEYKENGSRSKLYRSQISTVVGLNHYIINSLKPKRKWISESEANRLVLANMESVREFDSLPD